jgi:hypothetical protein
MALRKDESTGAGVGRSVDASRDKGVVIYRSNFDAGFDGWTDHWSGFRPSPIVSLTHAIQMRGKRSLMLSTAEGAYVSGEWSNGVDVFRRMAFYRTYRFYSYSAFFALGAGGYSAAWDSFSFYIDAQKFTSGANDRGLYQVQCQAQASPDFSRWRIINDAGTYVTVPSSTRVRTGDNENKLGFNYFRLTIDQNANSGNGGYHQLQVNQNVFDLSALGAGRGAQSPQFTTNSIDDFSGGFNIGAGLSRSTTQDGGCQLFLDDIVLNAHNEVI